MLLLFKVNATQVLKRDFFYEVVIIELTMSNKTTSLNNAETNISLSISHL